MSEVWLLSGVSDSTVTLFHVDLPDDGNYCRFIDTTLVWELRFDYPDDIWLLLNYSTGQVWYITKEDWGCLIENTLTPVDSADPDAIVTPLHDCTTTSWNCVDNSCVEVAGAGGTYATQAECLAACGGGTVPTTCCPSNLLPTVLYVHFGGTLAALGTQNLTWVGGSTWSTGPTVSGCGNTGGTITLSCSSTTWTLTGFTQFSFGGTSLSCSPFVLSVSGTVVSGACAGAASAVVNTTP